MDYQQQVCSRCGKPLMSGSQFCTSCGAPIQAVAPVTQPVNNYQPVNNAMPSIQQPLKPPPGLSKKEFMNDYSPEFNKNIRTSAIIGYVCAVISALLFIHSVVMGIGTGLITTIVIILSVLQIAMVVGFSLGLHLGKSKGCAIAFLVSNIVYTIIGVIISGRFTGSFLFVASISAVIAFSKLDKQYKQYQFETSAPQPVNNNQQFNNFNDNMYR